MRPIDLYQRSLHHFTDLTRQTHPDQWSVTTPCTDWDVRALVNHLVSEDRWVVPLLEGSTVAQVGHRLDGDLLGGDPAEAATDAANQAYQSFAAPAALTRTVHLSFGDAPAEEYLWELLADHVIHSWDLAVAIGADPTLDPELVSQVSDWFAEREDAYRSGGAIAERVPVKDDADPSDRLIAAFGRDPHWTPEYV